jgi:hypothetical protein
MKKRGQTEGYGRAMKQKKSAGLFFSSYFSDFGK